MVISKRLIQLRVVDKDLRGDISHPFNGPKIIPTRHFYEEEQIVPNYMARANELSNFDDKKYSRRRKK